MKRQTIDPGLGEKYSSKTKRVINIDGSFNVQKKGAGFNPKDLYQHLINISWTNFFLLVLLLYLTLNSIFAVAYISIGSEHLAEAEKMARVNPFFKSFFFSVQTFTTLGYGKITPDGFLANVISSLEAMTGLMTFALITGLLYGRFSHPSSRILYSKNAIIAPYKNINALEFRIANQRRNNLMELDASLLMVVIDKENKNYNRKYYNLKLERSTVYFFPLTWTIVHPIDDDSPFYGMSLDELRDQNTEILILIKGFDDTFSQAVHSRYSYTVDEIIWGARFLPAFYTDESGEIIFDLDNVHNFEKTELNK